MSLYIACKCGRAVEVPEGQREGSVACPDCGRLLPLDGGMADAPPPALQRKVVSDIGCLAFTVGTVVLMIAFPGLGKAMGLAALACCVAPLAGTTVGAWLYLRRLRQMAEERLRDGGGSPGA